MDAFANALNTSKKATSSKISQSKKTDSPELESNLNKTLQPKAGESVNPFAEALSKTGGKDAASLPQNPAELKRQQEELEKKAKKDALRKKLHDRINPVDLKDVYSQKEEQTKKQLEQVRKELKAFAIEVTKFYKEVDIAVFNEVVDPGMEGVGTRSYFDKLREFIKFLRKKVRSARTWLQMNSQKSKKKKARKRKRGAGIEVTGAKHEQTKAVFDQMHSERGISAVGA